MERDIPGLIDWSIHLLSKRLLSTKNISSYSIRFMGDSEKDPERVLALGKLIRGEVTAKQPENAT